MGIEIGWLALLLTAGPGSLAPRHPLDGPDVDLRITVSEQRVVCNAIFNLAFVDRLVDVPREDEYALHQVEEAPIEAALTEHLATAAAVRIDGIAVTPRVAAFEVDRGDPRMLPMFPTMGAKALIKIRVMLEYKALQPPKSVALAWHAYPPNTLIDDAPPNDVQALLTAGGVDQVIVLRPSEPEYVWHAPAAGLAVRFDAVPAPPPETAPLRLPLLALPVGAGLFGITLGLLLRRGWRRFRWQLIAGWVAGGVLVVGTAPLLPLIEVPDPLAAPSSLPTAAEAAAIFAPLHANIYRAFDYSAESDVYDALARSVHGDLLDALYHEVYRSLIMQEEGGAVSRVQAVRLLESDVDRIGVLADGRTPSFQVDARWQVDGAVFHWGHRHFRTNEHRARYTVVAAADGWRIAGCETLAQARIDARPDVADDPSSSRSKR